MPNKSIHNLKDIPIRSARSDLIYFLCAIAIAEDSCVTPCVFIYIYKPFDHRRGNLKISWSWCSQHPHTKYVLKNQIKKSVCYKTRHQTVACAFILYNASDLYPTETTHGSPSARTYDAHHITNKTNMPGSSTCFRANRCIAVLFG